ncbi:RNA-binding S4 domain-containing protein [soil metagenome]
MEVTRVDRWLWAVRLYKNRSAATTACRGGHVRVNGTAAKPATPIRVGDRVEAVLHDRVRILEVVQVIDKRVAAPVALECLLDHSPAPPPRDDVDPVLARESGTGRPTKRERRQLDRLRNR